MVRSLFAKYFSVLLLAVVVPLVVTGSIDAWFGYQDRRATLDALLRAEAGAGASRIQSFLDEVGGSLGWALQRPWSTGGVEEHRVDALRVLRQTPAVVSIALIDETGSERLSVSRVGLDSSEDGIDRSGDPVVTAARSLGTWYGPVGFRGGSEPFMTIAAAGNRRAVGIAVAEVNLKLIWEVISSVRVGRSGHAYVLDGNGRLIAHPDLSRVLRGESDGAGVAARRLHTELIARAAEPIILAGLDGRTVVAAVAPIAHVDWMLVIEQPIAEAFAPIRDALWRTGGLLVVGVLVSCALAYWLARRMTGPIRLLEEGARRIGAGHFEHRIEIATGDELERLAGGFNRMAAELALGHERSERIARLRRFLAPQVAALVEQSGDDRLLAGHLAEVVVCFCDLRGFTAFAAHAAPNDIMSVLSGYYETLGAVVTSYEATLTSFQGDGLMVLVNAPVARPDPARAAVRMALDMQAGVQRLVADWRAHGHVIGFGIGLAQGPATVGQIGYRDRLDYTAVGDVVNFAARLCALAENAQILVDSSVAGAVRGSVRLVELGCRRLKGYEKDFTVYSVSP
ncbi:MAG: adenylate/guanylate cyclase domain-containing protein [Geminicoccaceae bacterium]